MTVWLPTLKERRSDIPMLATEILERISQSSGRRIGIEPAALRLLKAYDFPGNIRELRNILWVCSMNAPNGLISEQLVAMATPQVKGKSADSMSEDQPGLASDTLNGPHSHPPRRYWNADDLAAILRRNRGNRRATARDLGVSERTVYRKLREFGL